DETRAGYQTNIDGGGFSIWARSRQDSSGGATGEDSGSIRKIENPAREEVRRVSKTDQQLGGGGVVGPTKNAGRRSASFDAFVIQEPSSKNSQDFAAQQCAACMAELGACDGGITEAFSSNEPPVR